MIKIIVDSTQNLPDDYLKKHDIRVAPIAIQFGNDTYLENLEIPVKLKPLPSNCGHVSFRTFPYNCAGNGRH